MVAVQGENVVFLLLAPSGDADAYQAFRGLTDSAPSALNQLPPI